jgi:hypothetical protein
MAVLMQLRYRRVASLCSEAAFYIQPLFSFVKASRHEVEHIAAMVRQ